ncbi:MAG TPA: 4-(cytidine 5'-diphospho)-2-C-methyl-D-erythritol kinase [Longimicrobiales bacterium]
MAEFFAPAKINLWLHIFAPDQTGYHPLDSLFCAIDLADHLDIVPARTGTLEFAVTGADVGPHESNLAYRAAREFYAACGLAPQVAISLHKNIPAGGGLGGGSSDVATVLAALNQLHDGVLPDSDLFAIAARIGSDVPFFLCGSPLAHASGRGQLLQARPPLARAPVLLAVPPFAIATASAYRWLDEARAYCAREVAPGAATNWQDVARNAHNDFEDVLFPKHPLLHALKQAIGESGALIALLSGSGSACFGVFDSRNTRDTAQASLNQQFPQVQLIATSTRM